MPHTSPVLESLVPSDRARLLERAVPRALRRGQSLYLAGESVRRAYVVDTGVLKLSARNLQGRSTILGLALPGDIVGDVGALDGRPQPLDALAATRCDVLGIDADLLLEMVARTPSAALEVARSLARSLRCIYGSAAERTTGTCSARLAGRLLDRGRTRSAAHVGTRGGPSACTGGSRPARGDVARVDVQDATNLQARRTARLPRATAAHLASPSTREHPGRRIAI